MVKLPSMGLCVLQGFFPGQIAPARIVAGLVVGFMRRPVATGAQAGGSVGDSGASSAGGSTASRRGLSPSAQADAGQQSKGQEED